MLRSTTFARLLLVLAMAGPACAPTAEEAPVASDDDVVGGKIDTRTAPGVGALVEIFNGGDRGDLYRSFCTATLIAPKLAVTAKHCTQGARGAYGFTLGRYATTDLTSGNGPKVVSIVERAEEETSVTEPTALGLGSDVALVHLREAVSATPIPVTTLEDADLGKPATAIGYGLREAGASGERRVTTLVPKAFSGLALAPLVSYEEYHAAWGASEADDRAAYDALKLLSPYEVVSASSRDGVKLCEGDSGGPLLVKRGSVLHVGGVASYVLGVANDPCAKFGVVHARFGPAARAMIDAALAAESAAPRVGP